MKRDFHARDGLTWYGTPAHSLAMQTVYVETSVISHAAARASRVARIALLQEEARRWWAECRPHYRVLTSQFVIDEASVGDPDAVARRLEMLADVPVMQNVQPVFELAEALISRRLIPIEAKLDAFHVASAVIAGVDYLVTQNCTHIANAATIPAIYSMLDSLGFGPVLICTPAEFLGEIDNGTQ